MAPVKQGLVLPETHPLLSPTEELLFKIMFLICTFFCVPFLVRTG